MPDQARQEGINGGSLAVWQRHCPIARHNAAQGHRLAADRLLHLCCLHARQVVQLCSSRTKVSPYRHNHYASGYLPSWSACRLFLPLTRKQDRALKARFLTVCKSRHLTTLQGDVLQEHSTMAQVSSKGRGPPAQSSGLSGLPGRPLIVDSEPWLDA